MEIGCRCSTYVQQVVTENRSLHKTKTRFIFVGYLDFCLSKTKKQTLLARESRDSDGLRQINKYIISIRKMQKKKKKNFNFNLIELTF